MAIKSSRNSAHRDSEDLSAGQAQLTSQARNQLAEVAEATSVMYNATESIQQINQQLTQRAALRHQQIADRLREANSPVELLAIQSTMFTSGLQEAAQYWQDVAAATLKVQSEMMERNAPHQSGAGPAHAGNTALDAWQKMFTASLNTSSGSGSAGNPLFDTWQKMFTAPLGASRASSGNEER
ncbi:MAG: phasin family protein [Pseudomonadota bacterium]|nr:phasin family protein [Pseudomonadota bacterium]